MLANEEQRAGYKNIFWDGKKNQGSQVSSGIYILKFTASNSSSELVKYFDESKKLLIIK